MLLRKVTAQTPNIIYNYNNYFNPYIFQVGPLADRLQLSSNQVTGFVAALTNYGGGDLNNLALSKSTTRRFRVAARKTVATNILRNFICDVGQINFDGKLLPDLYGFGKVNRLAVVLVQEDHNQLLCIAKTSDATGTIVIGLSYFFNYQKIKKVHEMHIF